MMVEEVVEVLVMLLEVVVVEGPLQGPLKTFRSPIMPLGGAL